MADDKHMWWQTGVVYQVYPRSFQDGNGDGVGDIAGVIERLDYLKHTLGIDALWLSPFYPSPMVDFGYDITNYTDVDPIFGTLADFDRLVAEAHQRGLQVIIDLVPNHTSNEHPWFLESRSSRSNPKADWYYWRDPKPDGTPPNNWLAAFGGGSSWHWDVVRGQYYLGSYLRCAAELNWQNPAVRQAMFDVVRFWLQRGADGFRLDIAHYVGKDPEMRDNPPNPHPSHRMQKPISPFDYQMHIHERGWPYVHDIYHQFRTILDEYSGTRPRFSVGEIHIFDMPQWATYYGKQNDELHMPFNFSLMNEYGSARDVRRAVDAVEAVVPAWGWPNYVLGNHDEKRLATRIGRPQARVAAMLLLTLRGTPTLYNGDELGMMDVPIPRELERDPYGINVPGAGRDPCRTPMQWTDGPNAGFSAPSTPQLWLPLADDYRQVNVQSELADSTSFLNLYRSLLAYRKQTPALLWGSYRPLDGVPEDCFVYVRQDKKQRILVALNYSPVAQHLALPDVGMGTVVLSTRLDRTGEVDLAGLDVRADEGLIVELQN
jgi:alpha-glucosidase